MRSLDNWTTYYDGEGKPFYGRIWFYKLHTTELQPIYNEDGTVALQNPMPTSQYGMTDVQVFLQDKDYTIRMEKWLGRGSAMTLDDPNSEDWQEVRTFDNLYPAILVETPEGRADVVEVTSIDYLRMVDVTTSGVNYAKVLGYYEMGDMPMQYYKLVVNTDPSIQDNGGSIIRPQYATNKVWELIPQENIDIRVFGVRPTETIQTVDAYASGMHACFRYANNLGKDVYIPQVYKSRSYYWLGGGSMTMWQKLVVDSGVHFVAVPQTTTSLSVGEIQFYGSELFMSTGDYGTLNVYCSETKTSWASRSWNAWEGETKRMIVDSIHAASFNFYDCHVTFENEIDSKILYFENCLIESNAQMKNCIVSFINCGLVTDKWLSTGCTVVVSGNTLAPTNFADVNTYIKWKNQQHEYDYGDLGEKELNNADIYSPCVIENASGTLRYLGGQTGTIEMHNVSGSITGDFEDADFNLIDCWTTIVNSNANNDVHSIQHRRGSLMSASLVNLHSDSYFEGVDIRASLVTPEGKSTFKSCHIRNTLATFDVDCFDCFIYALVTTYPNASTNTYTFRFERCTFEAGGRHNVTGLNPNGVLQNCTWIDNINKSGSQFVTLNRDVLDADDTHHTYVYEGNKGPNTLQYKAAKWTGKLHDPGNASCARSTGGWTPSSGGPSIITWTWDGAAMLSTGQAATDVNLYIAEFQMFSVGTNNLGELSLRTTPPSVVGVADPYQPTHVRKSYVGGIALTTSLSDVERTRAEWQYDQTGMPFCKGYAFAGGYTWRVTNAGTMFAFRFSQQAGDAIFEGDFNFEIFQ